MSLRPNLSNLDNIFLNLDLSLNLPDRREGP